MRRIFIALCLTALLAALPARSQFIGEGVWRKVPSASGITLIQHVAGTQCPGACSSATATLSGTGAGHLIVVGLLYCQSSGCSGSGATTSTVAGNETCAQVPSAFFATNFSTDIWYCKNTVGGSDTITATLTGGTPNYLQVFASEWSGANTSTPLDNIGTNAGNSFATGITLTTTANTASPNELLYSIINISGQTPTAGQTALDGPGSTFGTEYQISGAIGSYSNTWGFTGTSSYGASLGVFKQ